MRTERITPGDRRWIGVAEESEAAACRDLYQALAMDFNFSSDSIAGATVFLAPRIGVPFFNRVVGLLPEIGFTEGDLDRLIAVYQKAGISEFWVQFTPDAAPEGLQSWLAARDFSPAPRASWAKFVRQTSDPAPAPATGFVIRTASPLDAPDVARILSAAYGLPPALGTGISSLIGALGWIFFVACHDGRPIATGALHLQQEAGWLGLAATDAAYRGRGAQSALLGARIAAAGQAGCAVVVTETGEPKRDEANPSLVNIRRAGFVQVCSRLNYRRNNS
jgi:GNAT superfamily N-acetyltransferase